MCDFGDVERNRGRYGFERFGYLVVKTQKYSFSVQKFVDGIVGPFVQN